MARTKDDVQKFVNVYGDYIHIGQHCEYCQNPGVWHQSDGSTRGMCVDCTSTRPDLVKD